MSKTIETLNKLFDKRFIETSHDSISEPKEGMSRHILKGGIADEDILICRLDQEGNSDVRDLFPYLRGDSSDHGLRGMKRISDYAIFVDKGENLFVLLIELKKDKESPREQLDVTEPLIDFIFKRAKILKYIDRDYFIRKIGVTDVVDKRKTNERGNVDYDKNNFVKLFKNKHIYLRRLLH